MQRVFEKIIENLQKHIENNCNAEEKCNLMLHDRNFGIHEAIEIIKQVATEYEKDNYFNLDEVTLHKCPVCGGAAEHRVNKNGCWACGCFVCKVFKFDHNHGKAIQAWEDFCAEYNEINLVDYQDELKKAQEIPDD